MTWANFEITGQEFKDNESDVFADLSISQCKLIKKVAAKELMLRDLQDILGLESTDGTFEGILVTHSDLLKQALARKQLALYFAGQDKGLDSADYRTYLRYEKEYNSYKERFRTLNNTVTYSVNSIPIMR